jgi:phage shock protein PspC (stress-responsive transcriptional regulator)
MKKAQSINLHNMHFLIDEDALNTLEDYLKKIAGYFRTQKEGEEIMEDIEARISELFIDRTSSRKEIITLEDVEAVIGVMGMPEDFEDTAGEDAQDASKDSSQRGSGTEKKYRRMYRDPDKRILGGVCSGLGAYWGIDPVILRLLFLIAFFGFGVGLLIYLVLWIVMPEATTTAQKLEMRGEPVNISSIGNFVREEWENVRQSMNFGKNKK